MRIKLILLLLLNFWQNVNAQEEWTLKMCINYGLKNNRNNIIFANQKMAADAKAKEALADYLPQVSVSSTLDNNLKLQQSVIPAGIFGPDEVRVSLTQKYNSNAVAQLDQVIYDQSMITSLKANKYNKIQADLNTEQSQEAIIYNVSSAYFQIFVYARQLALLEYNSGTFGKQMEIYRLQVNKGITLQKDLDKVIVNSSNNLSQIRVAQSNLQLAKNELKFEMGFPLNEPLAVMTPLDDDVLTAPGDSNQQFSPNSKIEYKLAELNIEVLAIEQARIKAGWLPKLSGYVRYGGVGFGNDLNGAYNQLLPYSAVGLKLNIPIFNFYKRNAQYNVAKLNRVNAGENLKLSEGRYQVDYERAKMKLLDAETNVQNDRRNISLAESVFTVTDLQFQKGITDLTDWLNTQNSLKEAQNSYLNSLYSFYQSRIDLEKAAGTLKTFYNSL